MGSVTAIVSAYFAEEFIEGRIRNLMEQKPLPEIVVVAQAGSYEAEHCRNKKVHLIETADVPTLYDAWNMAIRNSSGEYLTNANSDDLLYPGALQLMAETLDTHPEIALCYADSDIAREYGKDPVNRMVWIQGDVEDIKLMCFMGSMPMWRASLHNKYGYFDEKMRSAGDYEFWLRIMLSGEKVLHIPQALGSYLVREESIYHSKPLLSIWEVARARSRYIKEL
jgi:glycosyltransferase involved in cell wall biosynthesis